MGLDNLNLLTFRLIILTLPAQYVLEIWNGAQSAIPPGVIIAMIATAIFSIAINTPRPRPRLKTKFTKVEIGALLWFAVLGFMIIALSEKTIAWCDEGTSCLGSFFPFMTGMIIVRAIWARSAILRFPLSFVGALMTPFVFILIPVDLMHQAIQRLHLVYDGPLYRMDGMLGTEWNAWFAALLQGNQAFGDLEVVLYNYMPMWTGIAAIFQQGRSPASRSYLLFATFILGLAGFGLYYLMPAIDPAAFFGSLFPNHLPQVQSVPNSAVATASSAFRNSMPSLHACSAILAFLALRDCPLWQRSIGGLMVFSIFCSTLGLGEHYAVDWVAAFPLVLFVRGVAAVYLPVLGQARRNAIAAGFLLEAFWVVAVRGAPDSLELPNLIRALAIASLVVPVILERQLARAERLEVGETLDERIRPLPGALPQEAG